MVRGDLTVAKREVGVTSPINEEHRRWIAELRKFNVCQLADALGPACFIETSVRPIDLKFRICGPALTVQCAPDDNLTVHYALHVAQPGDVLVVGGAPSSNGALWGELMSICAQSKCLAGTMIDGPVRDPVEIQSLGYPVFCRNLNPRRAAKENSGHINVSLRFGNLSVQPGDLMLADANGIICIECSKVQEAIDLASQIVQKETNIKEQLRLDRTTFEILELGQKYQDGLRKS